MELSKAKVSLASYIRTNHKYSYNSIEGEIFMVVGMSSLNKKLNNKISRNYRIVLYGLLGFYVLVLLGFVIFMFGQV